MGTPSAGASIAVLSGTHAMNAPVVLANGLVVSGSGTLAFGSSSSITDNGGGFSLTISGPGALILSGSDNYGGGTIVDAGTLIATNSNAILDGTSLTVGAGGAFIFDPTMSGVSYQTASGGAMSHEMVSTVPEPGTIALLVAAFWSAAIYRRFRRPKALGAR